MAVPLAVKLVILLLTATSVCTQNEPQKDGILVDEYLEHAEKEGIITRVQAQQLKKLARDMGEIETLAITPRPSEEEPEKPGVFMRMYNHLTLLNVLYFSGSRPDHWGVHALYDPRLGDVRWGRDQFR